MSKKLRDELQAIQAASRDGILHPAKVVSWARTHKSSALHRQFEWNNTKAANAFRLWQARRLIQLNVVTEDGAPQVVSLSYDRIRGGGYRSLNDVLSDRDLSQMMLNDALGELQRVEMKYQRVKELTAVWSEISRVRNKQKIAKAA